MKFPEGDSFEKGALMRLSSFWRLVFQFVLMFAVISFCGIGFSTEQETVNSEDPNCKVPVSAGSSETTVPSEGLPSPIGVDTRQTQSGVAVNPAGGFFFDLNNPVPAPRQPVFPGKGGKAENPAGGGAGDAGQVNVPPATPAGSTEVQIKWYEEHGFEWDPKTKGWKKKAEPPKPRYEEVTDSKTGRVGIRTPGGQLVYPGGMTYAQGDVLGQKYEEVKDKLDKQQAEDEAEAERKRLAEEKDKADKEAKAASTAELKKNEKEKSDLLKKMRSPSTTAEEAKAIDEQLRQGASEGRWTYMGK